MLITTELRVRWFSIHIAFQQLHSRQAYTGSGIDLAICRRIVENHHGLLTAKSSPGKSSVFIITLPPFT